MKIEFDHRKNARNIETRGISFELAAGFEIDTAFIRLDIRKDYGEPRFNALGLIGTRLCHMTYTLRVDTVRVISLRKANQREVKRYVRYDENRP